MGCSCSFQNCAGRVLGWSRPHAHAHRSGIAHERPQSQLVPRLLDHPLVRRHTEITRRDTHHGVHLSRRDRAWRVPIATFRLFHAEHELVVRRAKAAPAVACSAALPAEPIGFLAGEQVQRLRPGDIAAIFSFEVVQRYGLTRSHRHRRMLPVLGNGIPATCLTLTQ